MLRTLLLLGTLVMATSTQTMGGVSWVFKLTARGVDSLDDLGSSMIKYPAKLADQAGVNHALRWVDDILDRSKRVGIQDEFVESFGYVDAMDHYFHNLAKRGYFKFLDENQVDPSAYIKRTYDESLKQLKTPGRCAGSNCDLIYKLPDDANSDEYVNRLKREVFAADDVQVNLPKSLRNADQADASGDALKLDEIFSCRKP